MAEGGVTGVTEVAGGPLISSTAGLGAAIAARRLFPSDGRLGEIALQLADFSLKGQLPTGFFFESYHRASGAWQGVRGEPSRTLLSVSQSSRIAELLLDLAADLAAQELPHEKYFLAALRFVDFFFDGKARLLVPGSLHAPRDRTPSAASDAALGGLDLFFPLARVHALTGARPLQEGDGCPGEAVFRRELGCVPAPGLPRGPRARLPGVPHRRTAVRRDAHAGLQAAEPPVSTAAAAKARAAESTRLFASLLVPWIRVQGDTGGVGLRSSCRILRTPAASLRRSRDLPHAPETR